LCFNDIENEDLNNIKMFADDTSLYCVVEDQTSAAESLNEDLACTFNPFLEHFHKYHTFAVQKLSQSARHDQMPWRCHKI
jgi:hypothetical protein